MNKLVAKNVSFDEILIYFVKHLLDKGFSKYEIPKLIDDLNDKPKLKISSIFSHLAASDEDVHNKFTKNQISIFKGKILVTKNQMENLIREL